MTSEMKQQQLEWRRSQVLELASQGYSQRDIARRLQVDPAAVNRDIQLLRRQAQENLRHHIQEVIPEEYQRAMCGIKSNLKQTLEIAETVSDPRVKLQARSIANDCYKYIMDLTTNGVVVTDALKFVERKTEQVSTLQKIDQRIEATEEEIGEETTTNGVF
jgi:predicted transcriptional regulator